MIRHQVYLDYDDLRLLRLLAATQRTTVAQLIRDAMRRTLETCEIDFSKLSSDLKRLKTKGVYKNGEKRMREKGLIP